MIHRCNSPAQIAKKKPHPSAGMPPDFYYTAAIPTRTITPAAKTPNSDSRDAASRLRAALCVCTVTGAVMLAFALRVVLVPMVVFIIVMPGERLTVALAARAANWAMVALVGLRSIVISVGHLGMEGGSCLRVYDAHHAVLAVHALGAVVPDGHGVVDEDGEDRGRGAGGGLEAGEEALDRRRDIVDRDARVRERGLHDGVVLNGGVSGINGLGKRWGLTMGWNWNWTSEPTAALTELGVNTRAPVLFAVETWMTWTETVLVGIIELVECVVVEDIVIVVVGLLVAMVVTMSTAVLTFVVIGVVIVMDVLCDVVDVEVL